LNPPSSSISQQSKPKKERNLERERKKERKKGFQKKKSNILIIYHLFAPKFGADAQR
jgi:hypothetical protein